MALQLSTEYEALKHDVNNLFAKFSENQSVRFEDFAKEWRTMNFNCIFAATHRNTVHAKKRVTERLFRVASEFLSDDATFLFRVAAVYLLYSVYFKQITDQKIKIRMTPTMWKDLTEFLSVLTEHKHLDVAFIIRKLQKHRAFIFTALPKELMFGRHEFMLGIESMSTLRMSYEADKYATELLNNDFTESLNSIQSEYEKVKKKVLSESKSEEKKFLSKMLYYSNSGFGQEISQWIDNYKLRRNSEHSLIPESYESSQRPVLSQLQELNSGKFQDDSAFKAKNASLAKNLPSTSRVKNEAIEDEDDEEDDCEIFYKRSAMLKPYKLKVQPKRTVKAAGVRYKIKY